MAVTALQPGLAHQPGDPASAAPVIVTPERGVDARRGPDGTLLRRRPRLTSADVGSSPWGLLATVAPCTASRSRPWPTSASPRTDRIDSAARRTTLLPSSVISGPDRARLLDLAAALRPAA